MKFDIREKIALFMGLCLVMIVLWYMFLYAPQRNNLKRIIEKQRMIQKQYERILKNFSLVMSGSVKKLEISRKCIDILDNLPRKEDITTALYQIKKIGQEKDIRIISINPHNLSFSENKDMQMESQLEKIPIDIILEGRFINMSQYLFDLVDLPFLAGYSKIGIETSEEIYPETKAQITCILLFLNNFT